MNIQQLPKTRNLVPKMRQVKHIHFVGVGGVGMSGIAEVLANEGYLISGSDIVSNALTKHLYKLGATIYSGHRNKNIQNANVVIKSSAIPPDNPEIVAAKKACIPVIHRSKMLAELMRFRYSIVVSGTHGKTTTTAMLVSIYTEAGLDPTFVSGGLIKSAGVHARLGYSRYFITEADESDASLLDLLPMVAIITNIEADHMDTYQGNFDKLKQTFIKFLHNLPFYGRAIVCIDDPSIRELLPHIKRRTTTYGFSKDADLQIIDYYQCGLTVTFTLALQDKLHLGVKLNTPGRHNALNAVAAIAAAIEEGIDSQIILQSFLKFQGTKRRFDYLGCYSLFQINGQPGKFMLIDDYGHHPAEVNAVIKTARAGWPGKRLVMVFQPYRYTRTRDLYYDFVTTLSGVDVLLMLNVDSAGEKAIPSADSRSLCEAIRKHGKVFPILVPNINKLPDLLALYLQDNDLLLMQGAGTVGEAASKLAASRFKF